MKVIMAIVALWALSCLTSCSLPASAKQLPITTGTLSETLVVRPAHPVVVRKAHRSVTVVCE